MPRGAHGTAREARTLPMHAALHPIRPVNSESWYNFRRPSGPFRENAGHLETAATLIEAV